MVKQLLLRPAVLAMCTAMVYEQLAASTRHEEAVHIQRLGQLPAKMLGDPVVSKDGCHIAVVSGEGAKPFVVIDGEVGPEYDGVALPCFSSDGKHFAYAAANGQKQFVVVDGRVGPEYEGILDAAPPQFSLNGKRFAYAAKKGQKQLMVIDEQEGPGYDVILKNSFCFSSDGTRFVYAAKKGEERVLIVDGRERPGYDGIAADALCFGPDGKRFAYGVKKGQMQLVIVDGRHGPEYDGIGGGSLCFSPDGKRFAYAVRKGQKRFMVVDGHERPGYDGILEGIPPCFSSDGKRFAYATKKGQKQLVVVDNDEGQEYDGIGSGSLCFSPDGKRLAYIAASGQKQFVVIDGRAGPEHDGIGPLSFSPDGKRFAYAAKDGQKQFVVVNGQAGPDYDGISPSFFRFSPDGKRFVYLAAKGQKHFVVINGRMGPAYDGILEGASFSSDGDRFAYKARKGQKQLVVIEAQEGPEYDGIVKNGLTFRVDGTLEYLALKDGILYRLTHPGARDLAAFRKAGLQMMIPAGWEEASSIPQGCELGFIRNLPNGEQATLFLHRESLPADFGEPPTDTRDMELQWDNLIKQQFPEAAPIDTPHPKVQGKLLVNSGYNLTVDGRKVRRRYTYFIAGRTAFVAQATTPEKEWQSVLAQLDSMLASLTPYGDTRSEALSDEALLSTLNANLSDLGKSFPSDWSCRISNVQVETLDGSRSLDISVAFSRKDVPMLYKAAKAICSALKDGDAAIDKLPTEVKDALGESMSLVYYVGQTWGLAHSYAMRATSPIDRYRVIFLDSRNRSVGGITVLRTDAEFITSGRSSPQDIQRIVGMYVFE